MSVPIAAVLRNRFFLHFAEGGRMVIGAQ